MEGWQVSDWILALKCCSVWVFLCISWKVHIVSKSVSCNSLFTLEVKLQLNTCNRVTHLANKYKRHLLKKEKKNCIALNLGNVFWWRLQVIGLNLETSLAPNATMNKALIWQIQSENYGLTAECQFFFISHTSTQAQCHFHLRIKLNSTGTSSTTFIFRYIMKNSIIPHI